MVGIIAWVLVGECTGHWTLGFFLAVLIWVTTD